MAGQSCHNNVMMKLCKQLGKQRPNLHAYALRNTSIRSYMASIIILTSFSDKAVKTLILAV